MIASVPPVAFAAFPARWEDVEVVDGVLVDAPPRGSVAAASADAGVGYDRSGRVPPSARFGRLVSVVA